MNASIAFVTSYLVILAAWIFVYFVTMFLWGLFKKPLVKALIACFNAGEYLATLMAEGYEIWSEVAKYWARRLFGVRTKKRSPVVLVQRN